MADLRGNWRIILLVVMLAFSGVALFVPSASLSSGEVTGATNLQYGLELNGGTRIRSPVVGMSATQLDVQREDSAVVANVSERLGDLDPYSDRFVVVVFDVSG